VLEGREKDKDITIKELKADKLALKEQNK